MPSLIGSGEFGTAIDANYRKQIIPFSRFGSRKIVWFRIGHLDTDNGSLDLEMLNVVIDAIQTKGEIVTIGAPYVDNNWGKFIVGLFEDTFNNGNDTKGIDDNNDNAGWNNMSENLRDTIQNALEAGEYNIGDGNDVDVQEIYMSGAPGQDDTGHYGWTSNSDYAEPDFKRDFDPTLYTD